jgi:LuxR family maltose regulon positive regulatory protein
MLTSLLNEIAIIQGQFVLVLDDYHIIDARPVDSALTYLIEHLPPQMHLVITTREDPCLPLARLRARDQLTELRSADLRFTTAETTDFLNQGTKLSLSVTEIAQLAERTEGWIVGLQLAALSMQNHQDVSRFIQTFAGDHRYIVDYLVEEVLQHQPEPARRFLLQTSILERLNGPLCNAVTGLERGNERLEALERGNFFVVPLDDKRHWYRYHHLFAEVLSAHLIAEQPDQVATLHRRASQWYEQNGSKADAIHHALAARDFERAAALMELELPAMQKSRQEATFLGWLRTLPDELIHFRPTLCVGYAWALLASGELEAALARLQDAERWLDTTADASERPPSTEMVIVDKEGFRRLPVFIAIYRAAHAQASGDISNTIKYARRVLDLLPEEDHLGRGAATALLGLAFWTIGDLEAAYQTFSNGITSVQMAGNLSDAISGTLALADIRVAQGRLHEAMHTYERALQEQGESGLRGTADLYVGMSELYREQNDLRTAMQLLLKSKELGERTRLPPNLYRWYIAMARIKEAQEDLDGALDLFHEAEHLYRRDFFPNVRPVGALMARVWIAQGRLGKALSWAQEQGLGVSDDPDYLREFEHITLARLLLARYKSDRANNSILEAMSLLERLLKAAQESERTGSVLEILILQSLAYQTQGNISTALIPLQQALRQAKPENYVRMFVDEGTPMMALLEEAAKRGITPNYVHQLLRAIGADENKTPIKQSLIEPLSERELEVLRLLRTDLSGPEIADKLIVSLNTMRTHTKNIYNKLGVNNRRAAVRQAEELDLF